MYRYILCESCSHLDLLPLTSSRHVISIGAPEARDEPCRAADCPQGGQRVDSKRCEFARRRREAAGRRAVSRRGEGAHGGEDPRDCRARRCGARQPRLCERQPRLDGRESLTFPVPMGGGTTSTVGICFCAGAWSCRKALRLQLRTGTHSRYRYYHTRGREGLQVVNVISLV